MFSKSRAALSRQLAFSLILISILSSCKENGSVGAGFVEESSIKVDTIFVSDLPVSGVDPYLGKLTYSPIGSFSDPVFGDISSIAFFKPSIVNSTADQLLFGTQLILQLYIEPDLLYGNEDNPSNYSIYDVQNQWRGATFRMSDEIITPEPGEGPITNKVGSFDVADLDSTGYIEIPLSGNYTSRYISFFNNEDLDRDSTYNYENYGLAILPDDGSEQIVYTRFSSTRLMIITTEDDTLTKSMKDWGYDLTRENETLPESNVSLFSSLERFATIDFTQHLPELNSSNFVRAELRLTEDATTLNSLTSDERRPERPNIRLRIGPANDIAYDLAFNTASSLGSYDDGNYLFNITSLFNANLFGNTEINSIYLYAAPNSGLLSFNSFYGPDAARHLAPKLLIYSLVSE